MGQQKCILYACSFWSHEFYNGKSVFVQVGHGVSKESNSIALDVTIMTVTHLYFIQIETLWMFDERKIRYVSYLCHCNYVTHFWTKALSIHHLIRSYFHFCNTRVKKKNHSKRFFMKQREWNWKIGEFRRVCTYFTFASVIYAMTLTFK